MALISRIRLAKRRRGPAYERRQESRRAARDNAEKANTAKETVELLIEKNAEEADEGSCSDE